MPNHDWNTKSKFTLWVFHHIYTKSKRTLIRAVISFGVDLSTVAQGNLVDMSCWSDCTCGRTKFSVATQNQISCAAELHLFQPTFSSPKLPHTSLCDHIWSHKRPHQRLVRLNIRLWNFVWSCLAAQLATQIFAMNLCVHTGPHNRPHKIYVATLGCSYGHTGSLKIYFLNFKSHNQSINNLNT